jgi:plasmid stabilization system protein ParE
VAYTAILRPEAEDEAVDARRWYESRSPGLGHRFAVALDSSVVRIVTNPFAFPPVHGEIRRAVLTRFPYAVYFRIDQQNVVILAVHGRQDPARWQGRR